MSRPDVVLTLTDPPMIGDVGLIVARRFRVPLVVVSEDVFPEIAIELRRLESPTLIRLLRLMVETYLRRADRIVAIGEAMSGRLVVKGAPPDRIRVIENWVDTERITPQPRVNDWSRKNTVGEGFVVMHSGNVGHAQDVETLIRAASFLRELPDLRVVVIGSGAMHAAVIDLATRLEVTAVTFLPTRLVRCSLNRCRVPTSTTSAWRRDYHNSRTDPCVSSPHDRQTTDVSADEACRRCESSDRPTVGSSSSLVAGPRCRVLRDAYWGRLNLEGIGIEKGPAS